MNCCSHLTEISDVTRKTPNGCEECLKIGDQWIHLRLMKSFEPGEDWGWCYVDELFFESFPGSLTTEWSGVLGASV
jgi:hypothetical protein